jgi:glyoxylase-like metal-dependent hydrolase (beta-lactamase superfamily II)
MLHNNVTRRSFLAGGLCACCVCKATPLFAAPSTASIDAYGTAGFPTLLELGLEQMTQIGPTVWVTQLEPQLWLYSVTAEIDGGNLFPANGLILERSNGSLMIDTGYMPEQAETLSQWAKISLSKEITLAVATHFHFDRTGGIDALKRLGVRTLAHPLTCKLAAEYGLPLPEPIHDFAEASYQLDGDCQLFFPGAGHTLDNIVVWLPRRQTLFGGCILKSISSDGLGYLGDAVIADWSQSVRRLQAAFPESKIVIPGHGTIAADPIAHTLALLSTVPTTP